MAPVLATAFLLRSLITAVPPAIGTIRAELGLSETVAGLTVGLPVICFGVFAFVAPVLIRRLGLVSTMSVALVVLTIGALVRPIGSVGWLLGGTVAVGIGIAIGNVLIPVAVRRIRPNAVPRYMGYYTVVLSSGATLGSLLTGPLLAAGVSWQVVLFGWAAVAAALTAVWLASGSGGVGPEVVSTTPGRSMAPAFRLRRTWLITGFMGLQSLVFYACTTWLPTQLTSVGFSVAAASIGLAVFNAAGIITSFFGPRLVSGHRGRAVWAVQALGYSGSLLLVLGGGWVSWLGVLLTGFLQGSVFALALMFIAQTPDARLVGAVSAVAQGLGYLIASLGPSGIGALYQASGSWWTGQWVMAGSILLVGVLGLRLLRPTPLIHSPTHSRG